MIPRIYEHVMKVHFQENRQMLFLMGPRQVGKTTTAVHVAKQFPEYFYYSWDNQNDRRIILSGPDGIAAHVGVHRLLAEKPVVVFDEIHKYGKWKQLLKGIFDSYSDRLRIIVTGSSRLDVFKHGGDSLMGRYFSYRMHPLSVAEIVDHSLPKQNLIRHPREIADKSWKTLLDFGGFPEPFVRNDRRFFNRWRRLRSELLFRQDIRDITRIQEIGQIEELALILRNETGNLMNYSALARQINVSVDTIRRWLKTLTSLYYCFPVRPWWHNVRRSLRKEPKFYLTDWSFVASDGSRAENLIACALLKAVHFWTDHGFGDFGLWFVRDKEKREVDFLVTRDDEPWILVEVKMGHDKRLSPQLRLFQDQLSSEYAFQVALRAPFVDADCFSHHTPTIVPATTFLSQLI